MSPDALRDTHRAMPEESTTPDLVERWQEMADAYPRRDFDAMMSFFAPPVTWAEGIIVRVILSADIDEPRAAAERVVESRG
jgi:hypothetical protein